MNSKRFKYTLLATLLTTIISGCSALPALDEVVPDNTKKYRKADTMPPLDVPPDLSTARIKDEIIGNQNSTTTYSEYEEAANNPLASKYNITPDTKPALVGEGRDRHLMMPADREVTWQRIQEFWQQKNVEIRRQDERIGLMDTAVDPDGYAYRIRIESGETSKRTNIYVGSTAHEGNAQKDEAMLRQLAEFLGLIYQQEQKKIAIQQQNTPQASAVNAVLLDEAGGHQALLVEQDFTDVWSRVGRILDSKGFVVEDRDRSLGTYFVRYIDPFKAVEEDDEGILSALLFWQDDEDKAPEEFYYIKLISDAVNTKIVILDTEKTRISTDTAKRLLSLMQEQLAK
ncbi:MAG: hypothetical protein COB23_07635 [Methylophaga sp.]|nr:MAG: hypothetical protein COB23_07635 [Methylophaga sp.]